MLLELTEERSDRVELGVSQEGALLARARRVQGQWEVRHAVVAVGAGRACCCSECVSATVVQGGEVDGECAQRVLVASLIATVEFRPSTSMRRNCSAWLAQKLRAAAT